MLLQLPHRMHGESFWSFSSFSGTNMIDFTCFVTGVSRLLIAYPVIMPFTMIFAGVILNPPHCSARLLTVVPILTLNKPAERRHEPVTCTKRSTTGTPYTTASYTAYTVSESTNTLFLFTCVNTESLLPFNSCFTFSMRSCLKPEGYFFVSTSISMHGNLFSSESLETSN